MQGLDASQKRITTLAQYYSKPAGHRENYLYLLRLLIAEHLLEVSTGSFRNAILTTASGIRR